MHALECGHREDRKLLLGDHDESQGNLPADGELEGKEWTAEDSAVGGRGSRLQRWVPGNGQDARQ